MPRQVPRQIALAARSLAIDNLTAELVGEFESSGVPVVVLKGPAIATWLYRDSGMRSYGDSDLLVPPDSWTAAQSILRALGFQDAPAAFGHPRLESTASHAWYRGADDVDLHCTLWGVEVAPEKAWEVLGSRTVPLTVGGRQVRVLDPASRAMHIALHAAQHGYDQGKPIDDLELALELLPDELWAKACEVAARLGALAGFASGLRLTSSGQDLARRLGLQEAASVDALLRVAHVPLAQGFEDLAMTQGLVPKLSILRRELFPTVSFMRWWSPLARRGRIGLTLAYIWRPTWLALRAGPGLAAFRRARRQASSAGQS